MSLPPAVTGDVPAAATGAPAATPAAVPAATAGATQPAHPVTLRLTGLTVFAHHGAIDEERTLGQRFRFDVELDLANCNACRSDRLADAVDYAAVAAVVVEVATGFRFNLLESLAEAVCLELLEEFGAAAARVTAHKPAPALPHAVDGVSASIERTRAHLG